MNLYVVLSVVILGMFRQLCWQSLDGRFSWHRSQRVGDF